MMEHNLSHNSHLINTTVTPTSSRLLMHDYNSISWSSSFDPRKNLLSDDEANDIEGVNLFDESSDEESDDEETVTTRLLVTPDNRQEDEDATDEGIMMEVVDLTQVEVLQE